MVETFSKSKLFFYLQLTFILILAGCASFSNKMIKNSNRTQQDQMGDFAGRYSIAPILSYNDKGKLEAPDPKTGRLPKFIFEKAPMLNSNTNYFINIKHENKQLIFNLVDQEKVVDSIRIGGKIKNGMLYLDNKIFECHGIPYLLGGCLRQKIRLGKTQNGELLLQQAYDNSGAFLFFFWAGQSYNRAFVYPPIK